MIQIVLIALLPIAFAQYGHGGYGGEILGYGKAVEAHYPPQPYKFGYAVKDSYGSDLKQEEEGDAHGNKKGSYGYTDGHGIYRQVDYVADKNGFRAAIKTNEPGTSDQDSADVHIESSAPKEVQHQYSAPAPVLYKAQSYAAPSYSLGYAAPSGHGYSSSYSSLNQLGSYGKILSLPSHY